MQSMNIVWPIVFGASSGTLGECSLKIWARLINFNSVNKSFFVRPSGRTFCPAGRTLYELSLSNRNKYCRRKFNSQVGDRSYGHVVMSIWSSMLMYWGV